MLIYPELEGLNRISVPNPLEFTFGCGVDDVTEKQGNRQSLSAYIWCGSNRELNARDFDG